MSGTDEPSNRATSVEILPRAHSDVQLPPNTPAGIPILARVKYWAARRALESYVKALQVQEQAFRALEAREKAREAYETTLVRAERLDDLRHAEHLRIDKELDGLLEDADLRAIRKRATRAQMEAEAILSERRLEEIKNPKSAETESAASAGERLAADIAQMRNDTGVLKKALIDSYGGEDNMTEEDRELLVQVELAMQNKIIGRLENI